MKRFYWLYDLFVAPEARMYESLGYQREGEFLIYHKYLGQAAGH